MMRRPIIGRGARLALASGMAFDSTLNIVLDGNSHIAGVGGAQNITRVMAKTAPVAVASHPITQSYDATPISGSPTKVWQSDKGVTLTNLGIAGQTWRQMNGLDNQSSADVDAAWVAGKTNVLIAWEGTNSLTLAHRTPAQVIQDAADYIAARQATHQWLVVLGTVAPRQLSTSQTDTDALNANIDAYNALLRAQYQSMGAKALFDVRAPGSQFNFSDYLNATFEAAAADANTTLWATGETGAHTHFSSNGNVYIVNNFLMPAVVSLPAQ